MNRKDLTRIGMAAVLAAMMLTGCKSKAAEETTSAAEQTISEAELTDEASIEIGAYKGLKLTAEKADVTDTDVQTELENLLSAYPAEVSGRAAKLGDVANIDYVGTKDGTAFAGGTASGYDLALGSGTFIDGFEDGIVGMRTGEEKDLNLQFPDGYKNSDLAGQNVVFHVTLNTIKNAEESEIDDSLAKRVLADDNATLDQLKGQVEEYLHLNAENDFFNMAGSELLEQVIANSKVVCDPDAVDQMYDQMITTYTAYAGQYGADLDTFLSIMMSTDKDGLKESAENLVMQEMVLDEILATEKIEATEEQKNALAKMNGFDSAEIMTAAYGEESANRLFEMGAVYYYLIDNAVRAD